MTAWDGLSAVNADGQRDSILFIGATNRREDLDPAFLRRFTVQKHVGLPNAAQREQMLRHFLQHTSVDPSFDYKGLARRMEGWNGSLIKDSCRKAVASAVSGTLFDAVKSVEIDSRQKDSAALENEDLAKRRDKAAREAIGKVKPLTTSQFKIEGDLWTHGSDMPTRGQTAWSEWILQMKPGMVAVLVIIAVVVAITARGYTKCNC